jgi:hypothetical protein
MKILFGDFIAKLERERERETDRQREYIFKPTTGNESLYEDSKVMVLE